PKPQNPKTPKPQPLFAESGTSYFYFKNSQFNSMAIGEAVIGVLKGVFQMVILGFAGVLLGKLGPLDSIGDKKYSMGIYYLFLPTYCAIQIANAITVDRLDSFGYLTLSFVLGCFFSGVLGWIYCWLFKVDLRCRKSLLIIITFGNATTYPEVLIRSMCQNDGLLSGDPNCQYGVGYAMLGLFLLNVASWSIGPFVVSRDHTIRHNERRKAYVIKQFYPTMNAFFEDVDISAVTGMVQVKYPQLNLSTSVDSTPHCASDRFFHPPVCNEESLALEAQDLIEFSMEIYLTPENSKRLNEHFELLTEKLDPRVVEAICKDIPGPIAPLQVTFRYILSKLVIPPIVLCFVGFIVGLIGPLRDWILGSTADSIFMATLGKIGNIAIPTLVMTLGAKLSTGVKFDKDVNLRFVDVMGVTVIRLLIVPAIGIGFMEIITRAGLITVGDDKVLSFIVYSLWNLPPSVMVASIFLVFRYYTKEMAIIQLWTNIIAIATLTMYLVVYYEIFCPENV
ncbi:MAG: AEC family transporter, partial [Candidatus Pacebacteria bacterium]|nr:AEC family transporter [Candidatus Paceibacterota bacterium]